MGIELSIVHFAHFVLFRITALSQASYTFLDLSNEWNAIPSGFKCHGCLNETIGQRKTTFNIEYLIFAKLKFGSPAPCGIA